MTLAEFQDIERSVKAAKKKWTDERTRPWRKRIDDSQTPAPDFLPPISALPVPLISSLMLPEHQNALLKSLHFAEDRTLKTSEAQRIIQRSAEADDFKFFIRLGKVLDHDPFEPGSVFEDLGKLRLLLLAEWTRKGPGLRRFPRPWEMSTPSARTPLCLFTDPALVRYCCYRLGAARGVWIERAVEKHSAIIVKTRQRLGLKSAKHKLVRHVTRNSADELEFFGKSPRH